MFSVLILLKAYFKSVRGSDEAKEEQEKVRVQQGKEGRKAREEERGRIPTLKEEEHSWEKEESRELGRRGLE